MTDDDRELILGGGNFFADFGDAQDDIEQARAILAARIIVAMDARILSARAAEAATGVAASEFSRIRNARLERFTIDRLMRILGKLDDGAVVTSEFQRREPSSLRPRVA